MPDLHVEFPEELAYLSLKTLDLKSNNQRHVDGVVQITRQLHRNSHSVVYMGQMTENPKPLALKFAYGKDLMRDLRKEAKIYDERLGPVHVRGGSIFPLRASGAMTTSRLRETPRELLIAPGTDRTASDSLYLNDTVSITRIHAIHLHLDQSVYQRMAF
ncbi:hypothetical protein NEOLEDRAFT_1246171 [Neolentinus lepideus HHB14362 ss-1]|uniref:Uncharacterized protein n=1 Tax=Neolentinus lepideus HHB14362 ss-1 TaxID=1314782 RepID=A0A165MXK0_9AGAM|nr:hypothetical protein NEOLEDRAFT_1246171 [Neolentinus lepideus HHB14362 ss-1]